MKCINCNNDFSDNINNGVQDNKICPECFQKISKQYAYDSHKPENITVRKDLVYLGLVKVGLFLLAFIALFIFLKTSCDNFLAPTTNPQTIERELKEDALNYSFSVAKDRLISPSTANGPHYIPKDVAIPAVLKLDSNSYEVHSYVDAQNSFGAMIRTYYICKLRHEDIHGVAHHLTWYLISFDFVPD
jgi:hypothetical protein